jgi:hypothetical protein
MVEITNTSCNVIIIVSRLKSNTKENKVHRVFGNDFGTNFCDETLHWKPIIS